MEELSTESSEYWYYSEDELNLVLFKFWFDVCTQRPPLSKEEKYQALQNNADPNPEHYSIASLRNLRNGLSRCLSGHGKNINLTMVKIFRRSQKAFKDAHKELKQIGKGNVNSYPEIEHASMCKNIDFHKEQIFPKFQNGQRA